MSNPCALYRLYDEDDRLLYVGVSDAPELRWKQHGYEKPWWGEVARKEVEWLPTRTKGLAAERRAIVEESPAYNVRSANGNSRLPLDGTDKPESLWWQYVTLRSGGASRSAIAGRAGVTQPTVSRWRTSQPSVENVRAFARAYGRPVLEALVAAEHVSMEDAGLSWHPLSEPRIMASTDEILDELRRRTQG